MLIFEGLLLWRVVFFKELLPPLDGLGIDLILT